MERKRIVLLADMNAFYASVEQALNPSLRNRPIIVCGDPSRRHGIVLAASYEAKEYGVETGMAVFEAKRLCPPAELVPPRMGTYLRISAHIVDILSQFSPLVEPFSVDEAFVELTGCEKLFGEGIEAARRIKERILRETGIRCSIGVGPNKLLAKMAAEMEKPNGLTLLTEEDVPKRLWPLPVIRLFGVGPRISQHLKRMGIRTIGDLAQADPAMLERRFGIIGRVLHCSARGVDSSPVDPCSLDKNRSIGHQFTLPRDYTKVSDLRTVLRELAEEVAARARKAGYTGRTVSLTLRSFDFGSVHRSLTLSEPTNIGRKVFEAAEVLLRRHWDHRPVRLIGITLSNLSSDRVMQLDLFGKREREQRLAEAIDAIRNRFGTTSIFWARSLTGASVFVDRAGKIGGHRI
jgi:DNA polymerase-4